MRLPPSGFLPSLRGSLTSLRAVTLGALGFGVTAAVLAGSGLADSARAQALIAHDSSAPVDFDADSLDLQSRADRVVVSGNVVVRQAGLTLTAARLTIAYRDSGQVSVDRLDATGGVTVAKGADRASGDAAVYDLDRRIITMIGNVRLVQNGNLLQGNRMVIDLSSGRASVNGGGTRAADGSSTGGRVTGRFSVPDRK